MKIQLEYPFNEIWKNGYIVTNKEPRNNVILFNSSKDRSTIPYARYLMAASLIVYIFSKKRAEMLIKRAVRVLPDKRWYIGE